MQENPAGSREIEHTADWELEVWAPDLCSLFEQAARGMYALTGARFLEGQAVPRVLEIHSVDYETILVNFLSELVYISEEEGIGFYEFAIQINDLHLQAELQGAKITSMVKEIKAVTFHNIYIRETEHGFRVNLVFDV